MSKEGKSDNQAKQDNNPLFYKAPAVVSLERHAKAGLRENMGVGFAKGTNSIPLTAAEFVEAAKSFPITFTNEETPVPVVICGLEKENYFVSADRGWAPGAYVPAYVRKYPFAFWEVPQKDQLVLCVDEEAPHFVTDTSKSNSNKPMIEFYKDDKATMVLENAMKFCSAYQEQHLATVEFCKKLKELDLFERNQSNAELNSGRKITLSGFNVISTDKFKALPDEAILELHKNGWLPLVYAVLFSGSNWSRLVNIASMLEEKKAS